MKHCSKCQSDHRLEDHHFYPKCHYGNGKKNPHTITLCHECHLKIETIILAVESFTGFIPFGQRHKMNKDHYDRIHRHWLKDSKIINLHFA